MVFGKKRTSGRKTPGISEVLGVALIIILYVFYAGPFLASLAGKWASVLFTAGFGLIPVMYTAAAGYDFFEVLQIRPPAGKAVAGGLLLAAGMFLLTFIGTTFTASLFPGMSKTEEIFFALIKGKNPATIIISIAVLPAVCEEILFRGFILSGLKKTVSQRTTVILCGFLFALIHLDPYRFAFTFAIGLGLSWAAWESRSIFVPMLMHGAHNLVLLCITLYGSSGFVDELRINGWTGWALIGAAGGLLVYFGIRELKNGKNPEEC